MRTTPAIFAVKTLILTDYKMQDAAPQQHLVQIGKISTETLLGDSLIQPAREARGPEGPAR